MSLPSAFIAELRQRFTGEIRNDLASRILYSTDASIYQIEPMGVALPRTQEDLISAVELAAKYKIPILPRGAGTSLAGQAIGSSLILDCSRWLDRIVEINADERYAVVEPGVVLSALNLASAKYGLMFGPDPASAERATMGGVIANNATGAHSILYGMTADHLLSSDIILADGSLETWDESGQSRISQTLLEIRENYTDAIKTNWPLVWRNSAGYRLNYLLQWSPSKPARWDGEYPAVPSSFPNLAPLLAGSEGTLAIIRRARVNLVPKPQHTILAVLSYQSISEACDDVPRLLTYDPSAIELIPRMILRAAISVPAYARQMGWVAGDPAALLIIEFSGDQPQALKEAARGLDMPSPSLHRTRDLPSKSGASVATNAHGYSTSVRQLTIAESAEDQARIWNIRKVGLGLMDSRPQPARPIAFIEDCAIPVERLGEFVREAELILNEHNTYGGIYAHASGGCLHIRPVLDVRTGAGLHSLRAIAEATFALTLRLGGSMSSEHGDGIARGEWLQKTYGDDVTRAMQMLKHAADPDNLLNPNKMFDAPKMDSNLRYDENTRSQSWTPALDFSRSGNFITSIELCNGQGVCRKDTGVMCPSYQATREEMHSTRGRANLLRAMISSPVSLRATRFARSEATPALASGASVPSSTAGLLRRLGLDTLLRNTRPAAPRNDMENAVAQALDLCLACKGCKAECPSGVDMAKLKYEFENQYYKSHRRHLRDYIFGYFHILAGLLSPIAPLANAMMQMPVFKNIAARVLGITPYRPFPKFSGEIFRRSSAQNGRSRVIFLSDVFSRYIEPHVERAAFDVLSKCGYDVHVLPLIGAGASLLSKGFVDAARRHARRVLDALHQADPAREAAVIGVEPPEIYMFKHDYVDLIPGRGQEIASRAAQAWLLDEYLLRSEAFSDLRVVALSHPPSPEKKATTKIYFHPHCHQRAEGPAADGLPNGTNATVELLRLCGYDVELIESGCCGMAGTFGYEAEHYDLSMKIGELKLFPALRKLTPSQPPPNPKVNIGLSSKSSMSDLGEVPFRVEGVASTGAACRMQIQQGVGVEAEHPIVLVAQALAGEL